MASLQDVSGSRHTCYYGRGSQTTSRRSQVTLACAPAKRLAAVLEEVGLGALASELESVENWSQRLSPAEEQQLAFARILLAEPMTIFLDDATSVLDDPSEARLYGLLRTGSWRPTIVSASYKGSMPKFHDEVLDIRAFSPTSEQLPTEIKSGLKGS